MNHYLRKYSHKVGLNYWHFEWCTKYRYNMMRKQSNCNLVKAALLRSAKENNIKVHEIEVLPDHIHTLVSLPRGMTDSMAFQKMKGRSSFLIFKNKPKFRLRYPKGNFWARGGCAITVGYNDYNTTKGYINKQKDHHAITLVV